MKIISLGVIVLAVLVGMESIQFYKRFRISKEIVQNTKSFSAINDAATKKILVVGDSTAVGIGAARPEESIAGRFFTDNPEYSLENRAVSGQKLADTLDTLHAVDNFYDMILVQSGANDILFLTKKEEAVAGAHAVLSEAKKHSHAILFLTSGNIGLSPLLPRPIGWYYERRSRIFLEEFRRVAEEEGALFIDLYTTRKNDLFSKDIDNYYSKDYLHLSGAGYEVWYNKIVEVLTDAKISLP
jgi:lysophospholipase L1-like esterase